MGIKDTVRGWLSSTPDKADELEDANVIVTSGDLFEDNTRVVHIFVDGRKVEPEAPAPAGGRGRGRGGM